MPQVPVPIRPSGFRILGPPVWPVLESSSSADGERTGTRAEPSVTWRPPLHDPRDPGGGDRRRRHVRPARARTGGALRLHRPGEDDPEDHEGAGDAGVRLTRERRRGAHRSEDAGAGWDDGRGRQVREGWCPLLRLELADVHGGRARNPATMSRLPPALGHLEQSPQFISRRGSSFERAVCWTPILSTSSTWDCGRPSTAALGETESRTESEWLIARIGKRS